MTTGNLQVEKLCKTKGCTTESHDLGSITSIVPHTFELLKY